MWSLKPRIEVGSNQARSTCLVAVKGCETHRLSYHGDTASQALRAVKEVGASGLLATSQRRTKIALLRIDLQDGFTEDLVIVRVNGTEMFRKESVTTKLLLGYADSFQAQIPEGSADVEIVVPSRDLSKSVSVQVSQQYYLGVSIRDRAIEFLARDEPFSYA